MTQVLDLLAEAAQRTGRTVAVAESLTSGLLASRVGAGENASEWFAGGVVAYLLETKQRVLGLAEGVDPCSPECALTMAVGVRELLASDIAVSTTGVGGPDPDDGHPPGLVYLGWSAPSGDGTEKHEFAGGPQDVLKQTVDAALRLLVRLIDS